MEITILLRLLLVHFLVDFFLQPAKWVTAKSRKKERSPELYYHVLLVGLLSYIALWDIRSWYIALIILISHLLIDIWKCYRPKRFVYFLADQLLHVAVLVGLWVVYFVDKESLFLLIGLKLNSTGFWLILLAYYLVTGPLGIAIGHATGKWQAEADMNKDGLNKAGMWIGRCERTLILTFILIDQFTALGFLMAAKSLLRFGDAEERAQKKTEYILVGTLISFSSAALLGTIVKYLLQYY